MPQVHQELHSSLAHSTGAEINPASPTLWGSKRAAPHTHLVIEKADLEDVLHAGNPVCHRQVPHGVPQQDDARPAAQLLEILRPLQDAVVLVVGVDERSLEALEDSLCKTGQPR